MMRYREKWALVTGASSGIGEAFATSLAAQGANVVLVARRQQKLETLAAEISKKHSVRTRVIVADLTDPTAPASIANALRADGVKIDILVNNAGWGLPGYFTENAWGDYRDYLELMVSQNAQFVHLFLPRMIEQGYGRIIQVASIAGITPGGAGHTLYGACKAFLISFSQSLAAEYASLGVNVCAVCPGLTYSEFHDLNGARARVEKLPNFLIMPAAPVVVGALNAVERGKVVYVPGAINKAIAWLARALPHAWAETLMQKQMQRLRSDPGNN